MGEAHSLAHAVPRSPHEALYWTRQIFSRTMNIVHRPCSRLHGRSAFAEGVRLEIVRSTPGGGDEPQVACFVLWSVSGRV